MARFFEALKAGWNAFWEANEPRPYAVAGKPVRCPHCAGTRFGLSSALLNSRGRTALGADWADPSAFVLICAECGRIEWYAQEPDEIPS